MNLILYQKYVIKIDKYKIRKNIYKYKIKMFKIIFYIIMVYKILKCKGLEKYILNNLQLKYKSLLNNDKTPIVLCTGPAGTGKTMISCNVAIEKLKSKLINKIIITRPTITVEENIGYLPGTLEDKLYPFMIPIYDYFLEYYTKDQINTLISNGRLEVAPLAFMRGRTFENSFIIADEMQNSSKNQFKMLLTRIGLNSKLIITGDLDQNDLGTNNGLNDFIELLNIKHPIIEDRYKLGIEHINFDKSCIQRHEIIDKILNIYDN
jgi:phosphate starvation-inducible PhoH-like protein